MAIYSIKEIYYTLQGEGAHAGRPAIFCRFTGCNLWSGREEDRHNAICQFCDTDFRGTDGERGGRYTADELAELFSSMWPVDNIPPYIVFTGGEPLLQLDQALVDKLQATHMLLAIETNGTLLPPKNIDWICVSPKAGAPLVLTQGDELKLVYPQQAALPHLYKGLAFSHFYLQPMDGPHVRAYTQEAISYCLQHPQWQLSVQTHKYIGIP